MPNVIPPGGAVDWPADEGTLGVVGVAPWATLEFCRAFYGQVSATKDWHYPRVLLDINTKLPSRGRHLQLGEKDPSEDIASTIAELAEQGATVAVVVCNTAHILYERWSENAPIPILHIIEETIHYALEKGASHIAPLVSASLAVHDLYGKRADSLNLRCHRLEASDQALINRLIESIKVCGQVAHQDEADALIKRLKRLGVDTVIAGCTELSALAPSCMRAGVVFVDSNVALARAALKSLQCPAHLLKLG